MKTIEDNRSHVNIDRFMATRDIGQTLAAICYAVLAVCSLSQIYMPPAFELV
jgi:hypothetical protein